ncbi:hypothetical protein Tco_1207266 [Tanacetum coccineum]
MKLSRRVSFKAEKGNISTKGMEGLVFGDDESEGGEFRDDGFDGDLDSNAFSDGQSVDSRSCGDSVTPPKIIQRSGIPHGVLLHNT